MPSNLMLLLSRLQGVKKQGQGWIARCPSHEDRSPSLSIAATDDGKIIVHCFAGCAVTQIARAVGMTVTDLFPPRAREATAEERAKLRQLALWADLRACANVLGTESAVVQIAACDLERGHTLTAADIDRLAVACERIEAARYAIGALKCQS